jgi:dipeptidyl aminopeptidase/acylaminoacyl peptidase
MNHFSLIAALAIASIAALPALAAPPPKLPVETFFQVPSMTNLQFSPDGTKILCIVPFERRPNLMVIDLVKKQKTLLSKFSDKRVASPMWATNDRILFWVDEDGKEQWKLYAQNADGSDPTHLSPNISFGPPLRRIKGDDRNIIVNARYSRNDWIDVCRFNIKTARVSPPVAKSPGEVSYYVLDHANVVRFAVIRDSTSRMIRVLYRDANGQEWTELTEYPFDQPGWHPLGFDGDNRTAFVASDIGRKTRAVYRFDAASRQVLPEPVCADDTYDVVDDILGQFDPASALIFDEFKKKVVGITYEADRRRFVWLDDEIRAIHQRMEASLPDTVHHPIQFSEDGSKIIFQSYSDRDPGVFYLYDRRQRRMEEIAVVAPKVDPELMAPMKPVSYQARDGMTIHGYLTLPVGREPKNLPLIIHPHGGPYGIRDTWSFNAEVQFYANRGYAVFQIDYRGSGGYGHFYESAGFKKWGLEMQDDLTDGVKWAIEQGIADPQRVVISGASYGGYATMAGLVYTPELYAAGINYVGVVNIENVIPKAISSRYLYWMHTRLGNLLNAEDKKRIYETSPVHFADRIRAPLLMAYGRNDPRVPIDQAYDIERALKANKRPYQLIVEKDEGHGFRREEKAIAFYTVVDEFLQQHVPAQ